jgi:hypothetical protein
MISLKVSIAVHQPLELKAKLKVETDTLENTLPFDNLVIEALPSDTEAADLRLRIINAKTQTENTNIKTSLKSLTPKKSWWQKIWFHH